MAEKEPRLTPDSGTIFGAVLKEGLYEDSEQRESLLKLARFRSTAGDGLVSLADYVGRMKPGPGCNLLHQRRERGSSIQEPARSKASPPAAHRGAAAGRPGGRVLDSCRGRLRYPKH